jgi:hypothetical protein
MIINRIPQTKEEKKLPNIKPLTKYNTILDNDGSISFANPG